MRRTEVAALAVFALLCVAVAAAWLAGGWGLLGVGVTVLALLLFVVDVKE